MPNLPPTSQGPEEHDLISSEVNKSADELQRDLDKVRLWAWQWRIHFNVDKTEEVIFSQKTFKLTHLPLYLGPEVIATTSEHKH